MKDYSYQVTRKIYRSTSIMISVITAMLLLQTAAFGQSEGLTPLQVSQIKHVGNAMISPDGDHIAYTVDVPRNPLESNETPWTELHVLNLETGEKKPYVSGQVNVHHVQWTPNGDAISFLSRRDDDEGTSLYKIPLHGGEAQKVYSFETSIYNYDWSPGGDQIVFTASEPDKEEQNEDFPYQPEIYEENLKSRPAYVVDLSDEKHSPKRLQVDGTIYQVNWSPTGDHIAVTVSPTPLVDDYYMNQKVRIVSAENLEISTKINNPGKLGEVTWSPDGKRVAFIAGADRHDVIDGRLMVSSVENGDFRQLLEGYKGTMQDISWIDDETIRFIASRSVWSVYSQINYDGSGHQTLLEKKEGAIWNSFTTTSGGSQTAFVADKPHHPAEVYYMGEGDELPTRKTSLNPMLEEVQMAEQEMVSYEARDGKEIHGVLVRPVNEDPDKRYPVITVVHGGPEAHYDMGWHTRYSEPAMVAASRGFAVFFPNYRGSTGRGIDFLKSSQGDLAGKEFDDIVDGVDYLIDQGVADPDRVGVTGGSYGGYATAWMATKYTDRFAAGVMFVGVSDNLSKWGTSDIPQELYLVHTRERIWDDWDFYLKRSPIYHSDNTETPLLIMHGKNDTRVNPAQSYEMYRYLKVRSDVPVRLVLYPGEGHGNSHASARYDYQLRMLRWMEHYLKGPGGEKPDDALDYDKQ